MGYDLEHDWKLDVALDLGTRVVLASARSLAGKLKRYLRDSADRLLHPMRRRRLVRRLERRSASTSVLFVCLGNICRSPFAAESFLRTLKVDLDGGMQVRSGGLLGPGRPTPAEGLDAARNLGLDLSSHRSRLVDAAVIAGADVVVVMDTEQQRHLCRQYQLGKSEVIVLGDLDPQPIATRTIPDPLDRSVAFFEGVYRRIDRCTAELARALGYSTRE